MPIGIKHLTKEWKDKISTGGTGLKRSSETIRKMRGNKNALGHKHSVVAKEKIRLALFGNKYALGKRHSVTAETKVKISLGNKGKKRSKSTVQEMSRRMKGLYTGKDNPNWNGGTSNSSAKRARRINAPGFHTKEQFLSLKIKYGFMCLCCKKCEPEIKLTEDHIVPLSIGGSDDIGNIQPLCMSCNLRKFTKTIDFRNNYLINRNV